MYKPVIYVDFDNTISKHGLTKAPDNDALTALNELSKSYKIVIFSCRANPDLIPVSSAMDLLNYLTQYNVPYDEISHRKPPYSVIIDDRSFNPSKVSWKEIVETLENN